MSSPAADAGATEAAAYDRYQQSLGEQARLRSALDARSGEIEAAGRSTVDAAANVERRATDTVRAVERTMDAIRPRIRRVAAQAGPQEPPTANTVPSLDSLDACAALLRAIEVDLRAIESTWAWIERQRTHQAQAAVTPTPPAPGSDASPGASAPSAGGGSSRTIQLVMGATVLIVLVIVVLLAVA